MSTAGDSYLLTSLLGMYFPMYVPGRKNINKTLNTSADTFLFEINTV